MKFKDFLKKLVAGTTAPTYEVLTKIQISYLRFVKNLGSVSEGDDVIIKPAPTEEHPLSLGVFTAKGVLIGIIPMKDIKPLMTEYAGRNLSAIISKKKERNVEIVVTVYDNPPTQKGFTPEAWDQRVKDYEPVYVVKGGKVFHSWEGCTNAECSSIPTIDALKRGFTPCKKCYQGFNEIYYGK